jgi:HEAT repeat protein
MLDRLDEIDWASLRDAYGPATEFPRRLRAALSPDAKERHAAFHELHGTIVHQGTVYEASAVTVPFIIEALRSSPSYGAADLAFLLACIAEGRGYLEVHVRRESDRLRWEPLLAKEGRTLAGELEREHRLVGAVREAVAPGLDLLLPYLVTDRSPEMRLTVASALARYPDRASDFIPSLESALRSEEDEEVRKAIKESMATLRR